MPIKTCAWVRARLPLMAGGDSLGLDRWVVDRHLVRCDDCRRRLAALLASQAALQAASAEDPAPPGPPLLWADLARRARAARRPRALTAWGFEPRRAWIWPLAGLAAGLVLAASIVGLGARHDPRLGELVNDYVPIDIDQLLSKDRPRLLKPEDPEGFDRRRPGPGASYRESHAAAVAEPALPDGPGAPRRPAGGRPRVELTQ